MTGPGGGAAPVTAGVPPRLAVAADHARRNPQPRGRCPMRFIDARGRQSQQDITFFKNAGGGHFDLIACEAIYRLVSQG